MLESREFKNGVGAYWRALNKTLTAGVSTKADEIPDYGGTPPLAICHKARLGGGAIPSICKEFYNNIKTGIPETRVCPFGVTVQCARLNCGHKEVLFSVTLGRESKNEPKIISELKRYDRENAKQALSIPEAGIKPPIELNQFLDIKRFAECLVYGSVALPIRGYAHELLTPIQGLLNDINALSGTSSPVRESLTNNANLISDLAKRIQIIISGEIAVNEQSLRKVTLHKLVRSVVARHHDLLNGRNLRLDVGYDGGIPYVNFTPSLLELAISCVVENAIKYSFDGFSDKDNVITINFEQGQGRKLLKIQNNGCLITPYELSSRSIFDLGRRGTHSGDMNRKGTGNGLYIVEQILKAHRGTINARSEQRASTNAEPFAVNCFELDFSIYPDLPVSKLKH